MGFGQAAAKPAFPCYFDW